jgi:hypothetical protein
MSATTTRTATSAKTGAKRQDSTRSTRQGVAKQVSNPTDVNVVLVIGELATAPAVLTVAGETVTTFDLRVRRDGRSVLVPVRWTGEHAELVQGSRLGVHGTVSRRFFRVGPSTQSRTEVLAERVDVVASGARQARVMEYARLRLAE